MRFIKIECETFSQSDNQIFSQIYYSYSINCILKNKQKIIKTKKVKQKNTKTLPDKKSPIFTNVYFWGSVAFFLFLQYSLRFFTYSLANAAPMRNRALSLQGQAFTM